ncbi:SGNH/GDSL hydrolase family protein [Tundrisphaera lichenicola]|uniref:SGNH/GDSL hydrolase family protein n=1 Tax=Tundrisphaera lichenicola TaxID=2029860 RepID=UPI003EBCD11A
MRSFLKRRDVAKACVCLAIASLPMLGRASSAKSEDGLKVGTLRVGKILFLGNSITLHEPAPKIGWTGNWGMAASAPEKDYVHLLLGRVAKAAGGTPKVMIRNIADFERNMSGFNIPEALKQELAFEADLLILAIGENATSPKTDEARKQFSDAMRDLLSQLGQHGHPKLFVRGQFWPDAEKNRLLKQSCAEVGGIFVDLGEMGIDPANSARSERKIEDEGVAGHPGDRGMAAIADALWKAMKQEGEAKD